MSFLKRKRLIDLSVVDIHDEDTRSIFPLIERPVGSVTYEHVGVERLYKDIYIGSAERNYYVDKYHELCLCAYYNRRIPGKYEFIPEYLFFVTKQRICSTIFRNLGNVSDKKYVLEKYDSINTARASRYYRDFRDLKAKIDSALKWRKRHFFDPFQDDFMSSFSYEKDSVCFSVFEKPIPERKELVQFYYNKMTAECKYMSVSKEPVSDLIRYFHDFDELDKNDLHLRTFLNIDENAIPEDSLYHKFYKDAKRFYQSLYGMTYN